MKIQLLNLNIAFISLSFLLLLASCNKTEDVTEQFMRGGNSVTVDPDGNIIVAGYNYSTSKGYEAALMKVNAETGTVIWDTMYGNSYSDAFYSVKSTHERGYIAVGFSNKANASSPGMMALITDANGKILASKQYGNGANSQAFNVISLDGGGYMLAGYIQKSSSGDRDIYLVKINNLGDTLWTSTIGAKGNNPSDTIHDAAYAVVSAPDGGYFVTGSLKGYESYGGKIFLMKVSATGDSLWTRKYYTGIGFSLALTQDKLGIAIAGSIQNGNNQDIFLLKTDLEGNLVWPAIKTFGGSGFEYGATMVETSDGGFAITGLTDSKGNGLQDVYLITTNSTGGSAMEYTYGEADNDQGFGLVEMPDKGFCITGLSNSGGSYTFLNRVKQDGSQKWDKPKYLP